MPSNRYIIAYLIVFLAKQKRKKNSETKTIILIDIIGISSSKYRAADFH